MVCTGRVKNGVVVLDGDAVIPDGTKVRVEPMAEDDQYQSLRRGLLSLAGIVKGMPPDMARDHDHYLHGAPRK